MKTNRPLMMVVVLVSLFGAATVMAERGRGRGFDGGSGYGSGCGFGYGADAKGRGEGWGPGFRVERMIETLNLSSEQASQIRALHEENRAATADLRDAIQTLRDEMKAAWSLSNPDEASILDIHEQIYEKRAALARAQIQLRLQVIALLTPEQREKMATLRHHRRGPGRGKGGPAYR